MPFDPPLVCRGNFSSEAACEAVAEWRARGLPFDALFAGDDESAMGALRTLQAAGRSVPEDVALVGFADVWAATWIVPPLTTARVPIETAGLVAAQQLVTLIQTGRPPPDRRLPTEIVIRQSCGCPW